MCVAPSLRIGSTIPAIHALTRRRQPQTRLERRATYVTTPFVAKCVRSHHLIPQAGAANRSVHLKRRVEGLKQSSIAEWLEQARHGALCQNPRTDRFIPIRSDEDDRNVLPTKVEFPLKFRSGHARHANVEDQPVGLTDVFEGKELFRRRERTCGETEFPQQVG